MAFDSKKTILLEKTYLYVRASLGFQLEGTSTEKIPTNNGFYRFFVDNLQKAIGNSYVNILYDSNDLTLQCFCSDLYMDELMSSDSSAIEDVVAELKKSNDTILEFENGVSSAFESNHLDNVALNAKLEEFESGVSSALAANHLDNQVISNALINSNENFTSNGIVPCVTDDASFFRFSSLNVNVDVSDFSKCYKGKTRFGNFKKVHFDCNSKIIDNLTIYLSFCSFNYFSSLFSQNIKIYYSMKYINPSNENIVKQGVFELGSSSTTEKVFLLNASFLYNSTLLSLDLNIFIDDIVYNALVFYSYDKKFLNNCFIGGSSPVLVLNGVGNLSSCLNQDFCYDFVGGYINFKFYSSLPIDWLKTFTYTFITDVGKKSFSGEQLGLKYLNGSSLVVCTTFPNISFDSSPSRLLGVRVLKDSDCF